MKSNKVTPIRKTTLSDDRKAHIVMAVVGLVIVLLLQIDTPLSSIFPDIALIRQIWGPL